MGKAAKSTTIIGGADGPTSIFLAGGKERNIWKRIRNNLRTKKFRRQQKKVERSIVPGAHTMEETMQYMKQHYGAVEADMNYPYFTERKSGMKYSLIQRERPELLGEEKQFVPPSDFGDENAVREWHSQVEAWIKEREAKADAIPKEIFPTDYHMFLIDKGESGTLEIELDTNYPGISISYSGEKKVMEEISQDIYRYYGVSKEDIENRTERFQSLVSALRG